MFVNRCGTHTSTTRPRARPPRGRGAHGGVLRNRAKNAILIVSTTLAGAVGPAIAVEGGTDRRVFERYVGRFSPPVLPAGQVVLLDNLGAHKIEAARKRNCRQISEIAAEVIEKVTRWRDRRRQHTKPRIAGAAGARRVAHREARPPVRADIARGQRGLVRGSVKAR